MISPKAQPNNKYAKGTKIQGSCCTRLISKKKNKTSANGIWPEAGCCYLKGTTITRITLSNIHEKPVLR